MKEENEREEREIPERFEIPGPMMNLMIAAGLGFRAELFDGKVKMWPKDVEHPDDTNWIEGPDFANNLDFSLELLESMKIDITLEEDFTGMWTAQLEMEDGMIETDAETTQERAAAYGLLSAITILNANSDISHD